MSKKTPILDRWLGTFSLRLLKWVGNRANRRGDLHEAVHCSLGVLVAHSTHSDVSPCRVTEMGKAFRAIFAEQYAEFKATDSSGGIS